MSFLDDERKASKGLIPDGFTCPIEEPKPVRIDGSKNVRILTIEEMMKRDKAFAKRVFLSRKVDAESGPWAACLNANYSGSRFFFVDKGKKAELGLTMDRSMSMDFILLGEGSSLRLLCTAVSDSIGSLEVRAGEGARLDAGYLKHKGAWAYHALHAIAGTDSTVNTAGFWGGSGLGTVTTDLSGSGSSAHHVLLSTAGGDERLHLKAGAKHKANGTRSRLVMKGVAQGRSKTTFDGNVGVEGNGRGSDSNLSQQILLLDKGAKAEANPVLEIKNNNVECSHSAAIRQLEEEKLFYLMSRGLSRDLARSTMITGFLRGAMGTGMEKGLRNLFMPPFMAD